MVSDLSTNGGSPYVPAAWPPLPRTKTTSSFPPPPAPTLEDQPVWTDQVWASPLDIRRRVFCNRR